MRSSLLVRLFGFRAALHHGDALVWDRWRWIARRLRKTRSEQRVMDVGCGSGAFTIGLAMRGYNALGLSWDESDQAVARERAALCKAARATFQICDLRNLHEHSEWVSAFDIVLCCENIEHILDDFKLMRSMAACLKPGGRLLLTTPHLHRIPQNSMDYGPFPSLEDGRHVRAGYNRAMLDELCASAGIAVEDYSFISGPLSQLSAWLMWRLGERVHPLVGWAATLPLRPLPPLLDPALALLFGFPPFCIGMEAYKPRRGATQR
jgi:SAM-dependent methyltransferase